MEPQATAQILSIGDELLIGQVINTNQAEIARDLNTVGITIQSMHTVSDTVEEILSGLERAASEASIVVVTGGLGPTHDDVTRTAICQLLDTDLIVHAPTLDRIREIFTRRGLPITRLNEDQARVPEAAEIIPNPLGTASGYLFSYGSATVYILPGVPFEMKAMMKESILPDLASRSTGRIVIHRTIKTTGIAESHLAEKLGTTEDLLFHQEGLSMAYLPSPLGVRLRLTGIGTSDSEVRKKITRAEQNILDKAGTYVYGYDDDDLEDVVGRELHDRHLTIAVAESCTGGLISDRLTNVPGSSGYLDRTCVCYSNASKTDMLGVSSDLIERHGAVSSEVAVAMAEGIRDRSRTDIGLSTTGIAGPSGGSDEKPVGLVYIGYADDRGSLSVRFVFGNDRRRIKERAAQAALSLLRRKVLDR